MKNLSRLMLGTVQFGLPYGVANRNGMPSANEVRNIVAAAISGGVNCFDTAAAYGTRESILGKVLHALKATDKVVVVTKVRPLTSTELADPHLATAAITQSIETSRRNLRIECLPLVLFHRESDATYLEELLALRDRGWLRYAGVSCDNTPGPAARYAAQGQASALQIPCNLLDPRHSRAGSIAAAAANNVALFVRSVYLQGVLAMPVDQLPNHLHGLIPYITKLANLAAEAGMSLRELAVRVMLSHHGVTSLLVGVETVDQITENLTIFNHGSLPADLLAAVDSAIPELPAKLITPSLWTTTA